MTIRKSLPYHNIPRRTSEDAVIIYDREIDVSAVILDKKEKKMSKVKNHMEPTNKKPDEDDFPSYSDWHKGRFMPIKQSEDASAFPDYNDGKPYITVTKSDPIDDNMDIVFPSYEEGKSFTVKTGPKDLDGPLVTAEEEEVLKNFYNQNPIPEYPSDPTTGSMEYNSDDLWIQTYSGRRFNPTNPYVDAIVIQDIAHALSNQCRFSGHVKKFYSVAQHCVLVSYICEHQDALWGLLHDASEAYLVDVPSPMKRSGKIDGYLEFEKNMQRAICQRFGLPEQEPPSVKKADKQLLSTEARDLLNKIRTDWVKPCDPLPFKIEPLSPEDAKDLFMKRFFELTGSANGYTHYLIYKDKGLI